MENITQQLIDKNSTDSQNNAQYNSDNQPYKNYVSNLILSNFRNYKNISLKLSEKSVIILGNNGSGKTNILEAISLLTIGRGVRRAKFDEIENRNNDLDNINNYQNITNSWAIFADLHYKNNLYQIGTSYDKQQRKRLIKIDGEVINKQVELANIATILWLTPQIEGIFLASSSDKRKFLDRMVFHFDSNHISRINKYEYLMRERSKLLQSGTVLQANNWLDIIENNMAELSIAIAVSRREIINLIQHEINKIDSIFPKSDLYITGIIDQKILEQEAALDIEELIKKNLYNNRQQDLYSKRTNFGIHKSSLQVIYRQKNMPAEQCSTGEQKALLLTIILAEALAISNFSGTAPILLLDEITNHLDNDFRLALFQQLTDINSQYWLTGTEDNLFEPIKQHCHLLALYNGTLKSQC
ncbi:MAG: DNA replication/repair protein RecF [Pseudomonadota bacterium]